MRITNIRTGGKRTEIVINDTGDGVPASALFMPDDGSPAVPLAIHSLTTRETVDHVPSPDEAFEKVAPTSFHLEGEWPAVPFRS